jgi:hypothetical protein
VYRSPAVKVGIEVHKQVESKERKGRTLLPFLLLMRCRASHVGRSECAAAGSMTKTSDFTQISQTKNQHDPLLPFGATLSTWSVKNNAK